PADPQGVRAEHGEHHGRDRDRPADQEAVPELLAEVDPVPELDDPVEVDAFRQAQRPAGGVLGRRLHRVERDDAEREEHHDREHDERGQHRPAAGGADGGGHESRSWRRRKRKVTTAMISASTVAIAEPYPTFAFWKKFRYEKYEGTMVASPGPPLVSTKIGAKTLSAAIVQVSRTT